MNYKLKQGIELLIERETLLTTFQIGLQLPVVTMLIFIDCVVYNQYI